MNFSSLLRNIDFWGEIRVWHFSFTWAETYDSLADFFSAIYFLTPFNTLMKNKKGVFGQKILIGAKNFIFLFVPYISRIRSYVWKGRDKINLFNTVNRKYYLCTQNFQINTLCVIDRWAMCSSPVSMEIIVVKMIKIWEQKQKSKL